MSWCRRPCWRSCAKTWRSSLRGRWSFGGSEYRLQPTSFVHLLAVSDAGDVHRSFFVINRIYDAVISNANPPAVFIAMQLLAAGRTRTAGQFADLGKQPLDHIRRQILKLFFRSGSEGNEVFRHFNLPSARNSSSTSASVKRRSWLRVSDTAPSSMSSASIDSAVAITSSES